MEFMSPALAGGFLITQPPGKPHQYHKAYQHQKTCEDTKTASENAINNEGRDYQDGEHMYNHGWFMWLYGKKHRNIVISLQLK